MSTQFVETLETRRLNSVTPAPIAEVAAIACPAVHADLLAKKGNGQTVVEGIMFGVDASHQLNIAAGERVHLVFKEQGRYLYVSRPKKGGALKALYGVKRSSVSFINVTLGPQDDYLDASDIGYISASIDGGRGGDTLIGTQSADAIYGGRGDDNIFGQDGADTVEGNSGDDTLAGEQGDDEVAGGSGADTISGGLGDDFLDARDGYANDYVNGAEGYDVALADYDTRYKKEDKAWEKNSIFWGNNDVEAVS